MYTEPVAPPPKRTARRFSLGAKLGLPIALLALLAAGLLALLIAPLWDEYSRTGATPSVVRGFAVAGIIGLGLLTFALVFVWLVRRYVLAPIQALRIGAARLAAGELGHNLDIVTGDELEDLAHEFNRMSESLKKSQEELVASGQEKERLVLEAQARVREVSSLLEAGRAITSLDLESVLGVLAREAAAAVGADECAIYLLDEPTQKLVPRGVWGLAAGQARAPVGLGEGPVGWVAQHNQPLLLTGPQARTRFGLAASTAIGGLVCLPLSVDNRLTGVMQANSRVLGGFKPGDERLLSAFADQAAVAVKNAQLFEEERRRARELAVINQINRTITASLDLEHTLRALLSALGDLIAHDLAQICLWDNDRQVLRTRARGGEPRYVPGREVYAVGEGLPGAIMQMRAPIYIPDLRNEKNVTLKLDQLAFPVRSALGVLLTAGRDVVGTLELYSYRPGAFSARHITTLETLAGQAAVAIENARFFAESQRRLNELSGLHEISQTVSALTDPAQVYAQLTQRIAHLLNVEMCGVLLYDERSQALIAQQPFFGMPPALVQVYRLAVQEDSALYPLWNEANYWIANNISEDDVAAASGLREVALAAGMRSTLLASMKVGSRRVGMIQAANKAGQADFNEDDAQLLMIFATQAAALIENAQLFTEVRRRAEETLGLYRLSALSTTISDFDELIKQVMTEAAQLLGAEIGILLLLDAAQRDLILQPSALYGVRPEAIATLRLSGDDPDAANFISRGRRVFVSDNVPADKRVLEIYKRLGENLKIYNVVGVPLIAGDRSLGEILLCNKPGGFSEDDVRLLTTITSQFALAVERALLFTETRRRVAELEVLRQIGQALSSTLDLEQLLEALYEQTRRVMFADNFYVALYDSAQDEVEFAFYMSRGRQLEEHARRRGGNGLTEHVIHQREAVILRGDVTAQAHAMGVEMLGLGGKAWLGAPMISGDRVLGMLSVQSYDDSAIFDEGHLRLLQAIASQAAITIENARLYKLTDVSLRQRVDQLTALTRVSRELNATLELDHVMRAVMDELLRTTGATCGNVSLADPVTGEFNVMLARGCALDAQDNALDREAMRTGRPSVMADYSTSKLTPPHEGIRAALTVPIRYEQNVIGLVHLHSQRANVFDRGVIDFIEAIAAQAAIAAGNAQRFHEMLNRGEQLRRRVEQGARLFEISQAFRSNRPLQDILEEAAYAIQETLGFELVVVSLLEEDGTGARFSRRMASAGVALNEWERMRAVLQPWGPVEVLLRDEFRISQSYYIPIERVSAEVTSALDVHDLKPSDSERVPGRWHSDDMFVTLMRGSSGGQVLGLISLDVPRDGAVPSRATVETLEIFANQAAAAIENSRLFAALQTQHAATVAERDRLAQLHVATLEVQRSTTLDEKLHAIAQGIRNAGWARVLITLRDEQLEPISMITAGFSPEEEATLRATITPGSGAHWRRRIADPRFEKFRIGMAYYVPIDDPLASEFTSLILTSDHPRRTDIPDAWDPRDGLFLTLVGPDGAVIGVISLDEPADGRRPTEASLQPIELFAQQATYAITSARLVQSVVELKEFNENIVHSIQQGICVLDRDARIISVNDYMNMMYGWTAEVIGENIFRYRPAFAEAGLEDDFKQLLATGEPVSRLAVRNFDQRGALLVRNFYGYPLRSGAQINGVVILVEDVTEKTRLEEADKRRAAQLAVISEIGNQMSSLLDLDAIFSALVESVQNAMAFQQRTTSLLLVDEETDNLLVLKAIAGQGATNPEIFNARIPFSRGVIGRAARTARTQLVTDTAQDPDYFAPTSEVASSSQVAVPIMLAGRVLGVLNIDGDRTNAFDESDKGALETLADQAAVAIQNARLFQETTVRARQLGAIQAVTATVNAGTNLLGALPAVLPPLRQLAPVDHLLMWVFQPDGLNLTLLRVSMSAFNQVKVAQQQYAHDTLVAWAVDNRQPLLLHDLQAEQEQYADAPAWVAENLRCLAVMPLMLGERVVGALGLGSQKVGAFTPRDLQPFAQIAGQLASAVERSRLFEETERRLRQQIALYEASSTIAASLDQGVILRTVVEQMGRMVNATSACYYEWDHQRDTATVIAEFLSDTLAIHEQDGTIGRQLSGQDFPILQASIRERKPQTMALNSGRQLSQMEREELIHYEGKSVLFLPLVVRGQAVGCFEIWNSRDEHVYADEELRAMQALAGQAGIGIENARLFQETGQRVEELATIARLSQVITATVDLDGLFELLSQELSTSFNTDSYYIALYDAERNRIAFPLLTERGTRLYINDIPAERGLSAYIIRTRQPLLIYSQDELESLPSGYVGTASQSYLGVPMTAGDRLAGVIAVQDYERTAAFSESHMRILATVAPQIAVAIENARLYAQTLQRTRELEALLESGQAISASLDLEEVLRTVAARMLQVANAQTCALCDWDVETNTIVTRFTQTSDGRPYHRRDEVGRRWSLSDYPLTARVLKTRQPATVLSNDPQADPDELAAMVEVGAQAVLLLPLVVRDQVVGLVELEELHAPRAFTDTEIRLAQVLANQAAIALENARLFNLQRDRAAQQAALYQIGRQIASNLDRQAILDAVVEGIQTGLGHQRVGVMLADEVAHDLFMAAMSSNLREVIPAGYRQALGVGLLGMAAVTGQTILANDTHAHPDYVAMGAWDPQSELVVPLKHRGRVIGVLNIENTEAHRFTSDSVMLLEALADQLSVALANAETYESEQRRRRFAEAMREAAEAVSSTLDVGQVLERLLDQLRRVVEYDTASIQLLRGEEMVIIGGRGFEELNPILGLHFTVRGNSPNAAVIERLAPVIVDDLEASYPGSRAAPQDDRLHAWMGIPLMYGDEILGMITVDHHQVGYFTQEQAEQAQTFASQAAVALQNARLFQETTEREQFAEALGRVSLAINATLDLTTVLDLICQETLMIFGVDSALVWLQQGDQLVAIAAQGEWRDQYIGMRVNAGDTRVLGVRVVQERRPIFLNDLTHSGEVLPDVPGEFGVQAVLGVPLLGQESLGVLMLLDAQRPEHFTAADLEKAAVIGTQAAIAIENARLFQDARTRAAQLSTLNEIGRLVSEGLELDTILESIYQNIQRVMPLDVFYVALYDPIEDLMHYPLLYDGGKRYEQEPSIVNREGMSYRVIESRHAELVLRTSVEMEALLKRETTRTRLGDTNRVSGSLMAAPLIVATDVIGILAVQSYSLNAYTHDHLDVLSGVSNHAAVAIRNARLFQQIQDQSAALQRRVDELAVFNELGQVIGATLNIDSLVRALHYQVGRLMDAKSFYVALYDAETDEIDFPYSIDDGVLATEDRRPRSGLTGRIIDSGQSLFLRSADAIRAVSAARFGRPALCYLGVPLLYGERVIGVMAVQSYEREEAYGDDDLRILSAVAHQAAIAVENARLYAASLEHAAEIEERAQRLALINRVSVELNATLNEQEVMDTVVREIGRSLIADQCRLVLFDAQVGYGLVRSEYVATPGIENVRIPMADNIVFKVSGAVAVDDVSTDPRLADVRDQLVAYGIKSVLIIPVVVREEVIGSVGVDMLHTARAFTTGEVELAQTLVNQAATSLQNARLFEQIRRFSQELEQRVHMRTEELARANRELLLERDRIDTLFRITAELATSLDLDRVLNRALQLIVEAVGATQGSILLLDHETETLWYRAALGRATPLPAGGQPTPFRRGEGLGGWVMRHREPVIIGDLREDPRWMIVNAGSLPSYLSVLCVPLGTEEPLGVLMLGHPQTYYFTESELRLVAAAASQVASAISNAELYGLIREQAERLGTMLRGQQTEAAKSQAILEGVADGVMVTNSHGSVVLFNAAAERILGLGRDTMLNRPAEEFIGIYGRAGRALAEATERWTRDPASYKGEYIAERLQLESRVVSVHLAPVLMGEEYLGTVSVFRDITKEVEVDRMKSEFVSTVSHELRTPMTSIKGYADLLLLGAAGAVSDTQRRFLDVIKSNADRLSALVNDLLDISRIETGRVELDLKQVALQEVIAQVIANLRGRSRQEGKEMEVIADVPVDLAPVEADHDRVTQVLTNLVDNAFNYTPPGGRIIVRAREEGNLLRVSVVDNGIGIPPENVKKIFDRFFRGDDPAVQLVSGTGLGLAIVSSLVQMHGGRLSVESPGRGQGSTFSFTLPLRRGETETETEVEPA